MKHGGCKLGSDNGIVDYERTTAFKICRPLIRTHVSIEAGWY